MIVIPAIDIQNGKCVRLTQGKFSSQKIYSDNPVTVARQWEKDGAQILHVVDLDGARQGKLINKDTVVAIAQAVSIPVQMGGGVRNIDDIEYLVTHGIARVILGTLALEDESLLQKILTRYKDYLAIALDAKNGILMTKGWQKNSNKSCIETARALEQRGVQRFVYTDILKDGTLTEPNYAEISKLQQQVSVPIIISGGISTIGSLKKLKPLNIEGVIIGKAFYEQQMTLKEAIDVC